MEKETVLEIEFQPIWDKWAWRITKQNEEVLVRDVFLDKKIGVMSDGGSPDFIEDTNYLFIRGFSKTEDNKINICSSGEKTLIEEKVKAINEKYSFKRRWRAEKYEIYYLMFPDFSVSNDKDWYSVVDNACYDFGNYFKTKAEALEYAEYMRKKSLEWNESRENNE